MSTEATLEILSTSSEDTEHVAESLGKRCKGGEVIELISDLGGGKTTFVRGLARGLGSHDHISSPTFKISNIYKAGKLELHHFDFYRLPEAGIIADELAEVIGQPRMVVVIEWGEVVQSVLPDDRLSIRLLPQDEHTRTISFSVPPTQRYLTEGLER